MSDLQRLSEIQTRLDNAKPAPWIHDWAGFNRDRKMIGAATAKDGSFIGFLETRGLDSGDADLIANAPADLAFLLSEVRALTERINKAKAALATENAWDGAARADQLDAAREALAGS